MKLIWYQTQYNVKYIQKAYFKDNTDFIMQYMYIIKISSCFRTNITVHNQIQTPENVELAPIPEFVRAISTPKTIYIVFL